MLSLYNPKIFIFDELMGCNLSKLVRMPKYGRNFFAHILANVCPIFIKLYIRIQKTWF